MDKLKIIKMSGHSRLTLGFVYHGKSYEVEPYEINDDGRILRARDVRTGELGDFKIGEMFRLEITERDFYPKYPIRF